MRDSGRIRTIFAALGVAVLLGGCTSGPAVRATTDPAADFAKYHSYGFVEHLGTDRGDYSTIVSRALRAAVAVEMDKRGYRQAANPDLLVNFQANIQHTQQLTPDLMAAGSMRFPYRFDGGFYGCLESARDVNEGTLNVDVVDRARMQSVWEGVALGHPTDAQMRQPEVSLPPMIASIFAKYPYAAGRGTGDAPRP